MAKNYFPHDHNARHDRKLIKLRLDLGMSGIGIYWSIIEMLYEENGEIKLADLSIIAKELKEKLQKIEKVLMNYELFENNGEVFWSNSVISRIKKINSKSSKATESATKRWAKDANALRTETETQCEGNASKVNKSKVKEIKVNKSKEGAENFKIIYPWDSDQFKQIWLVWTQYKKEQHNFVYKPIGEQGALKDLADLSGGKLDVAIEIINQSINKGWKGFFELKNNHNGTNQFTQQTGKQANVILTGDQHVELDRIANPDKYL